MPVRLTPLLLLVTCATGCRQVTDVAVSPAELLFTTRGQSAVVSAQPLGHQGKAIQARVTFASSDESVATVDQNGRVTAHKSGSAIVTATAGDRSASVDVDVRIPARLTLEPSSLLISGLGSTARFEANVLDELDRPLSGAAIAWTVEEPGVASVLDGLVTATGVGRSSVVASFGSLSASAQAEVKLPAFDTISLDPARATLAVGAQQLLAAMAKDAAGALVAGVPIRFESSAPHIASVDTAGRIVAIAPGTSTIRAIAGDRSASMQVVVKK